jgi:hypothetical protein
MSVNGHVYKISPSRFALAAFKGLTLTYSAQKDAVETVEKVCAANGWTPKRNPETTGDNCVIFLNEKDGSEIARVVAVPVPKPRWAGGDAPSEH